MISLCPLNGPRGPVLRRALFYAAPPATVLVLVAVGACFLYVSNLHVTLDRDEWQWLHTKKESLLRDLTGVSGGLLHVLEEIGRSRLSEEPESLTSLRWLQEELQSFSQKHALYDQVRYLNVEGKEVLRIDYMDGNPVVVAHDELQDAAGQAHFAEALRLFRGQIHFSSVELSTVRGRPELPLKPIIRFGAPVFGQQEQRVGIISFNCLVRTLLSRLGKGPESPGDWMLLDTDGYWLRAPVPQDEYGFLLAGRKNRTLGRRLALEWQRIQTDVGGQFRTRAGLFTFTTVHPLQHGFVSEAGDGEESPGTADEEETETLRWKLVSYVPRSYFAAEIGGLALRVGVGSMIILVALAAVCLRLACVTVAREVAESGQRSLDVQLRHKQKMAAVGTLAGGMAHEINNPVNGIMNYAQLISDRANEPSRCREMAHEIIHEAERIAAVVKSLLAFSEDQGGNRTSLRIHDIIEQILALVRPAARKDNIHVHTDVPAGLPSLRGSAPQLRHAIMGLCSNAIDAVNARYPDHSPDKVLKLSVRSTAGLDENTLCVVVEDHGCGMDAAVVDRAFEPFFTTKDRAVHPGLGLTVCLNAVEQHKGTIRLDSRSEGGTRVRIELPAETE